MKNRTPISIFPFLSVLLSTMGVLSFLAVTFLLFNQTEPAVQRSEKKIEVRWIGAPPHVRPILIECRKGVIVIHSASGKGMVSFTRAALEREVGIVKELMARAGGELGAAPTKRQLWMMLKREIPYESRLIDSFTRLVDDIERDNNAGKNRRLQVERYPILLIYPDGLESYELASYLLDITTRLATGLEPMLKGWDLPYSDLRS